MDATSTLQALLVATATAVGANAQPAAVADPVAVYWSREFTLAQADDLHRGPAGWINPDSHREYKRLLQENRRLRKAIRERDRHGRRLQSGR